MTSRWKQRESRRPSSWRQSLLFNSLLLLLPIMAARIVTGAYTSDIATDPMGLEARTETRAQIEQSFRELTGPQGQERTLWAERVEQTLSERDFSATRGYLLAAPLMLDRQTSLAVQAAAEAEETGTKDQRLVRASLLFLPDPVRASYERAIAPPQILSQDTSSETVEDEEDEELTSENPNQGVSEDDNLKGAAPATTEPFANRRSFVLIGTTDDLVRQSQRWIAGDHINTLQLRLRALGLMKQQDASDEGQAFAEAASVLIAAQRAGRLNERFQRYLSSRTEEALPEAALKENLTNAFEPVLTTSQRAEQIIASYSAAIEPEALERLSGDMKTVSRLVEITSSSGALTLLELANTPDDMRRALLLSESGGERSIALARELGPDVLGLAQIGVKWTRGLVLQVMALMALGMALLWTALSAVTQADTIRSGRF